MFMQVFIIFTTSLLFCHCHNEEHESHIEEDHRAFLGRRKDEFDYLTPEEAQRRLRLLVPHIDVNKDGFVTSEELEIWVREKYESLLDTDDADAMFRESDSNFDQLVSWDEYLWRHFGIRNNATDAVTSEMKTQFADYILRDIKRWKCADVNGDKFLDQDEFHMFVKPRNFEKMIDVVAEEELKEIDINSDGFLSLNEYLDSIHMPDMRNWDEQKFHNEYDRDDDGKLNLEEVKVWKTPELYDRSKLEAKHLIEIADENEDGKLSSSEIVLHHFVFVGSKATQSGALLHDEF